LPYHRRGVRGGRRRRALLAGGDADRGADGGRARAEGDDPDFYQGPALAVCVQLALAGPYLAPSPETVTRPPLTLSAFGKQAV